MISVAPNVKVTASLGESSGLTGCNAFPFFILADFLIPLFAFLVGMFCSKAEFARKGVPSVIRKLAPSFNFGAQEKAAALAAVGWPQAIS